MSTSADKTINNFLQNLVNQGKSKISIKNYKSDIGHFLSWITLKLKTLGTYIQNASEITPFVSESIFSEYRNYMVENKVKTKTTNRRLSTLRNFSKFLYSEGLVDADFMQGIQNVGIGNAKHLPKGNADIVNNFRDSLISQKVSPNTIKNYAADVKSFVDWSGVKSINDTTSNHIKSYREEVLKTSTASTFDRKVSSLKRFFDWALHEGHIDESPVGTFLKDEEKIISTKLGKIEKQNNAKNVSYNSFQARIVAKFAGKPNLQKLAYNLFYTRPKWYQTYHTLPIATYFNYAILILLMSSVGFGVYNQFFKTTSNPLAYPTSLTRAGRYLSFQGRLTNILGNPITSATNVDFKLYDAATSGTVLWDSSVCSITPDSDGIFSTLLGSSCGSEIPASVFSENSAVWLGVTVGTDAEATPRVQIATVAYALNSETLQGYPASSSATANTVPVMNNSGQIVLAASSPKIQSTSGNFGIEGQAVTITTPTSSNGNITLSPDGTGVLNLTFAGAAPGGSAEGFVNATNANITSGALYYGEVASNASGYNLLQLASGSTPTDKFTVDSAGNTMIAGNITSATWTGSLISALYGGTGANNSTAAQYSVPYYSTTGVLGGVLAPSTSGYVLTTNNTGGAPTWTAASGLGTNYWKLGSGTVSPFSDSLDVLIGNSATTSAKFAFKNVSTGTPTASISGSTTNVATYLDGDGNLSLTNMANLTLGSSTTGNVVINSRGSSALTANGANLTAGGIMYFANGTTYYVDASGNSNLNGGTFAGDITVNNNDIFTNTAAAATVFNTNATSLSMGGAASTIGIGAAASTTTFGSTTVTLGGNSILNGGSGSGGTLQINSTSNATKGNLSFNGTTTYVDGLGNLKVEGYATASASLALGNTTAAVGPGHLNMSGNLTALGTINGLGISSGTITSGTWNGTAIGSQWGGTGANNSAAAQYSIPYYSAAGVMGGVLAPSTSGYVLSTNDTGSAPSWIPMSAAGNWSLGAGVLYPGNTTLDVLIGGSATTSAKFAFKNVLTGIPTASISGSANIATFIDGNGNISSTNRNDLVLGNSAAYNSTGNILLNPNGFGNVGIGTTSPLSRLSIFGTSANSTGKATLLVDQYESEDILTASASGTTRMTLANDGTLNLFNASSSISNSTGDITISPAANLNITSNATISGNLTFYGGARSIQSTATQGLTIGGSTTGNITLNPLNAVTGGYVAPNTTNVSDLGTASLLWRNIYGTTLYQGANQVCDTSGNCGSGGAWTQGAGILYPNSISTDVLIGGTATTSAKFAFKNVSAGTPTASISGSTTNVATYLDGDGNLSLTNMANLTLGSSTTGNVIINSRNSAALTANGANLTAGGIMYFANGTTYYVDASGNSNLNGGTFAGTLTANGNTQIGNATSDTLTIWPNTWTLSNSTPNLDLKDATVNAISFETSLMSFDTTNTRVGIGTTTPTALLDVAGAASVSGSLTFRAGAGSIQTTTVSPLTIGGSTTGNITLNPRNAAVGGFVAPNTTNVTDLGTASLLWRNLYSTNLYQGVNLVCDASGANCPYWDQELGTLFAENNTTDLLIGGSATTSAKFAFKNVLTGTPTASISGSTANVALFMDGNGNISTTNRQDLTLGNSTTYDTTGNILLNPNGTGYVGIGTASPQKLLDVRGSASIGPVTDDTYGATTGITSNLFTGRIAEDYGAGKTGIYSYRLGNTNTAPGGTSLGVTGIDSAITAYSEFGNNYSAAIAGYSYLDYANSASVLGGMHDASLWGALGFNDGTNNWAGYFNGDVNFTAGTLALDNGDLGAPRGIRFRESTDTSSPTGAALYQANDDNLYIQAGSANYINLRDALGVNQFVFNTSTSVLGFGTAGGGLKPSAADSTTAIQIKDYSDNVFVNFDSTNQRVGIGTITPNALLSVAGTASISGVLTMGDGTTNAIQSAYGPLTLNYKSGDDAWSAGLTLTNSGYVGIGTTTPAVATDVNGYVRAQRFEDQTTPATFYIDPAAAGTSVSIEGNIVSNGAFSISSGGGNITIDAGGNDVIIGDGSTSKLNAGTIDPPYTIAGNKYATYVSSMTGVKEETTGTVTTSEAVPGQGYRAALDFEAAADGSDLWIFSNVTELATNLDKLVVLLSPSSNTKAWYTFDASGKIYIYTSRPTTVSYRLTAPRFDAENWSNKRDADEVAGFIIPDTNIWPGTGSSTDENQISFNNLTVNISTVSGEKKYSLADSLTNTIVDEVLGLSKAIIANVKAGMVVTEDLATTSFTAFQGTVDTMLVKSGLVAANINTKLISPLADETDVTIKVGNATESGKLAIENGQGQVVASINSSGDATFSGTLYADKINSKSLDDIKALLTQVQVDQSLLSEASTWGINSSSSASLDQIATADLYVTNQAAINTLSVTNTLMVGTDMVISTNSIDTLSSPLKIQSLAMAPIEIMAGLIKIDTNGNVQITGNLAVGGNIESSSLNLVAKNSTESGQLLTLHNQEGNIISSVDSSGSAQFTTISTQGLTIAGADTSSSSAVINGVITTNATAGSGSISAGTSEVKIKNPNVSDYTLVYVTPTSSTQNYVLYVKSKAPGEFVVGFTNPIDIDVNFNWWIVKITQ